MRTSRSCGSRQIVSRAGGLEPLLLVGVVGDVLPQAGFAAAVERDDRRAPRELARDIALEAFEPVGFDLERELRDEVVRAHLEAITTANATYSAMTTAPSALRSPWPA